MRTVAPLGALALGIVLVGSLGTRETGAANEPYLIGGVVSESGPGSTLGRPEADSMQMAVDEINKAGGINGHPLRLKVLDDESNGTAAVNAVRQLLDQHPVAILGSWLTQTSLAMVPLVTQAGVPMISFASNAQVIEPVAERKWIFKMPIADTHVAQLLQAYMKRHNQTKLAAIYRDDDYGKTGLAHFEDVSKNQGIQVVDREAIAATASDATTQLTHVKAANPQALLVWTTLPSANVIIRGYRELGMTTPIYYSDGAATGVFLKQAGSALNGAYIATTKINVADQLAASDPQKKVLEHYAGEFVKLYPKDAPVSIFGGFGYDGVYVLKEALQKAGAPGAKLRDALEHVTHTGVSGIYRMSATDHNGLALDSLELTQIENQQFKIVR